MVCTCHLCRGREGPRAVLQPRMLRALNTSTRIALGSTSPAAARPYAHTAAPSSARFIRSAEGVCRTLATSTMVISPAVVLRSQAAHAWPFHSTWSAPSAGCSAHGASAAVEQHTAARGGAARAEQRGCSLLSRETHACARARAAEQQLMPHSGVRHLKRRPGLGARRGPRACAHRRAPPAPPDPPFCPPRGRPPSPP